MWLDWYVAANFVIIFIMSPTKVRTGSASQVEEEDGGEGFDVEEGGGGKILFCWSSVAGAGAVSFGLLSSVSVVEDMVRLLVVDLEQKICTYLLL